MLTYFVLRFKYMRTFSLNSCNTCQRIHRELDLPSHVEFVNIKDEPLTAETLERLKKLSGSYEALFSKRAQLYKKRNLNEQLSEESYKSLYWNIYFLKRRFLSMTRESLLVTVNQ